MPAQHLYLSPLFLKASAYARKYGDFWYVLSAKHGLVDPDEILEPYNETLNRMSASERRIWAHRVLDRLAVKLNVGDLVTFLAGQKYREYLIKPIEEMGCCVEIPLQGKRIGEQLSWFNKCM